MKLFVDKQIYYKALSCAVLIFTVVVKLEGGTDEDLTTLDKLDDLDENSYNENELRRPE